MDQNKLFEAVYAAWKKEHKKSTKPLDVSTLTFEANVYLMNLRDAWIAQQADGILATFGADHLLFIQELIYERAWMKDEAYANSLSEAWGEDGADHAEQLAYTLAVIKWYTCPPFVLQEVWPAEAHAWLEHAPAEPVQLALF